MDEAREKGRRRIVAYWLLTVCLMVFAMIVLGGVTRLTHSGLSMVDWKPLTRWLPPMSQAEWQHLFDLYRQSPEYLKINVFMDLAGFKSIFWLEFLHRLWGRFIGIVFVVPALLFFLLRWVDWRLGRNMMGMFILGGLQGVLGWYMVKSGLVDDPDVSQYRLTAHLGAALLILGYMLWVAMSLLRPERHPTWKGTGRPPWSFAVALVVLVFVTALSGGFVAGLDAGLTYNTFPLMDGDLVPDGIYATTPFWLAAFEDVTTVQFDHRILAEITFVLVVLFWWRSRGGGLSARAQSTANALALAAAVQVILGITTLLLVVPVSIAALHQAGAVVLYSTALWAAHALRPERNSG